jgi:hypothetical protein
MSGSPASEDAETTGFPSGSDGPLVPENTRVPQPEPRSVLPRGVIPRWCGIFLLVLGVLTLPWTAGLAVTLPSSERSAHYDVSWTGFDLMLCALLLRTGWTAMRRREQSELSAAMTGTLLVIDAWFDVLGAPDTTQFLVALAMALCVELPLAGFCFWMAKHVDTARLRRESVLTSAVRRIASRRRSRFSGEGA